MSATTLAPSSSRRFTSHEPTMPVAPVTNTRRPRQSSRVLFEFISLPHLPWSVPRGPELVQQLPFAQRIHRLPEALVPVGHELAIGSQPFHGVAFPQCIVAGDIAQHPAIQHEEAAVDPALPRLRLLREL